MRLLKNFLFFALSSALVSLTPVGYAATQTCKKLYEVKQISGKENACTKVSGRLVWKPTKVGLTRVSLGEALEIPDGFTVQIENFDSLLVIDASVSSGLVTVDEEGLITVTGDLKADDILRVKLTKWKFFKIETLSGALFKLKTIPDPVLASQATVNDDGINLQITNFDNYMYWEVKPEVGEGLVDNSGLISISGISKPGKYNFTLTVSSEGFKTVTKSYSFTMPTLAIKPSLSAISNQTISSFQTTILNYDTNYKWTVSTDYGKGLIDSNGRIQVAGLSPNQSVRITVTSTKDGEISQSTQITGKSLPEFTNISERDWALIAKDPDGNAGRYVIVYGYITQFDAATGLARFRADVNGVNSRTIYSFNGTNTFLSGDAALLRNFVAKDYFLAKVLVRGSYSYTTISNGTITVPELEIVEISRL